MKTLLKIGPKDHGCSITDDELRCAEFVGGYKYELIDGRLYVTYAPDLPGDWIEKWLFFKVHLYATQHSQVINYLTNKARIFVPGRKKPTIPEPDFAAYCDFPTYLPIEEIHWEDVSPFLVAEILSKKNAEKDLVRNVQLFLQVPSIKEYWILDPLNAPERPTLLVYRRRSTRWQNVIEIPYGEVYTTRLLPGFKLLVDPRQ
jgi:Uma2 family endonuclease